MTASMLRRDGRQANDLRPLRITPGFIRFPQGSCLIEVGETRVICTATVEETVPPFLRDSGRGWVTAEYSMLPGSSQTRIARESTRGKVGGRTQEIQRLIGRSLRATIDMVKLGQRTIWIDCDVIQADGGTRTASITGAYVALVLAVQSLRAGGIVQDDPMTGAVAAVSAGIVDGFAVLDLSYEEDSRAEVDMNFVMTDTGALVEVQGTAESQPFSRSQLDEMLALATAGIGELIEAQRRAIEG
jgi:ribonuclease PH